MPEAEAGGKDGRRDLEANYGANCAGQVKVYSRKNYRLCQAIITSLTTKGLDTVHLHAIISNFHRPLVVCDENVYINFYELLV